MFGNFSFCSPFTSQSVPPPLLSSCLFKTTGPFCQFSDFHRENKQNNMSSCNAAIPFHAACKPPANSTTFPPRICPLFPPGSSSSLPHPTAIISGPFPGDLSDSACCIKEQNSLRRDNLSRCTSCVPAAIRNGPTPVHPVMTFLHKQIFS